MDGQGDSYIPLQTLFAGGITICLNILLIGVITFATGKMIPVLVRATERKKNLGTIVLIFVEIEPGEKNQRLILFL